MTTSDKETPNPEAVDLPRNLVLASGSPRRREMLQRLGLTFTTRPMDLDETPHPGEEACPYVLRLGEAKARAAARPGELVLAADTTVAVDGDILGKPESPAEAREMLSRLAGRQHEVYTGVGLCAPDQQLCISAVEKTVVSFARMSAEEIAWYVDSGEPMDKAGAYGIQGLSSLFITGIEGDYNNVVGLPLAATYRLMRRAGWDLLAFRAKNANDR